MKVIVVLTLLIASNFALASANMKFKGKVIASTEKSLTIQTPKKNKIVVMRKAFSNDEWKKYTTSGRLMDFSVPIQFAKIIKNKKK
jgi:hypothetical protein